MHRYTLQLGRTIITAVAIVSLALVAGCSGSFTRGLFTGYVIGSTAEEIEGKVGKPVSVDASNPDKPRWVYQKKTFDPDNGNQTDEKTTVILELKDGKLVGADIIFG
jgi:hypothetical protein